MIFCLKYVILVDLRVWSPASAVLARSLRSRLGNSLERFSGYSMRSRLFSLLAGLAVMLPAAIAFAQKAPPGDVGSSASEPSMLLMAAAAAVPLLLLRRKER